MLSEANLERQTDRQTENGPQQEILNLCYLSSWAKQELSLKRTVQWLVLGFERTYLSWPPWRYLTSLFVNFPCQPTFYIRTSLFFLCSKIQLIYKIQTTDVELWLPMGRMLNLAYCMKKDKTAVMMVESMSARLTRNMVMV